VGLLGVNIFGVSFLHQSQFISNSPNCVIIFPEYYTPISSSIQYITDSVFMFGASDSNFAAGLSILAEQSVYHVVINIQNVTTHSKCCWACYYCISSFSQHPPAPVSSSLCPVPTPSCHTMSCYTLSQVMENPSQYFTSNTTAVFPPGYHKVSTEGQLVIQNISNIFLVGDSHSTTVIQCMKQFGLAFINITNLTISEIYFSMCGVPISYTAQQASTSMTMPVRSQLFG